MFKILIIISISLFFWYIVYNHYFKERFVIIDYYPKDYDSLNGIYKSNSIVYFDKKYGEIKKYIAVDFEVTATTVVRFLNLKNIAERGDYSFFGNLIDSLT